jgi:hypothetical protein
MLRAADKYLPLPLLQKTEKKFLSFPVQLTGHIIQ